MDQLTFSETKIQLLKDGLVSLNGEFRQDMLSHDKFLPLLEKLEQTGVDIIEFKQNKDSYNKISEIIKLCIDNYQIKSLESVLDKSKIEFDEINNLKGLNPIQ